MIPSTSIPTGQRSARATCRPGGWLWIAAWMLLGFRALAVQITQPPEVEATPTNAVVHWVTDVPCGGRVTYGTSREHLDRRSAGEVGSDHRVVLRGLKPGTEYWYSIGTLRLSLATNRFATVAGGTTVDASVAPPGKPAEPGKIPAARATWGNVRSLQDHFDRHGADFGAKNPEDYAAKAWTFLRDAKSGSYKAKLDENGDLRVYDAATKSFAAYNKDGTAKTFFKPERRGYFDDQPGTPATALQLQEFPLPR